MDDGSCVLEGSANIQCWKKDSQISPLFMVNTNLEAFCSPSAAMTWNQRRMRRVFMWRSVLVTLARASRAASASAAMALWSWTGSLTSFLKQTIIFCSRNSFLSLLTQIQDLIFIYWDIRVTHISTRSTLTPQGSVASSRAACITWDIACTCHTSFPIRNL